MPTTGERMSRIRQVEFLSQVEAEGREPRGRSGIISITSPDIRPASLKPGWRSILRISFNDAEEHEPGAVLFSETHARSILSWLDRYEDRLDHVIVYCYAGVSRSAAVARFIADRYVIADFDRDYDFYNKRILRILERHFAERVRRGTCRAGEFA